MRLSMQLERTRRSAARPLSGFALLTQLVAQLWNTTTAFAEPCSGAKNVQTDA